MTCDIQALVGRGHGHSGGIDVAASGLQPGGIGQATPPPHSKQDPGWPLTTTLFPKMYAHVSRPAHSLRFTNSGPGGDSLQGWQKQTPIFPLLFLEEKSNKWYL